MELDICVDHCSTNSHYPASLGGDIEEKEGQDHPSDF